MGTPGVGDVVVRRAHLRDRFAIGAVLTRAFATDPQFRWLLGGVSHESLRRRWFFENEVAHRLRTGSVNVALHDGQVVGAALWAGPRIAGPSDLEGLHRLPAILAIFAGRLRKAGAWKTAVLQHHPRTPHWYLACIGVDPNHQGLGIAGALMRSGLAHADRGRMPAYLESSKPANVPIYAHFGFVAESPLDGPEGAPPLIPMWRPATR